MLKKPITVFISLVLTCFLFAEGISAFQSEEIPLTFGQQLSAAAIDLTKQQVKYDPSYFKIRYPLGDVPPDKGVCTDVVIRAYRKLNVDLQELVHLDMVTNFKDYPKLWNLKSPDTNIDHRRVPNLMTFFSRKGTVLPITSNPKEYLPGDIVCWNLGGKITHIGLIVNIRSANGNRPMIVHNIGQGQVIEDMLFDNTIIGHFRYYAD